MNRTLRRSDLDKLLEILEVIPVGIVASQQQGLGQDRVGTVMRAFYASLFSTMTPHFERLQDLELRETTRRSTAEAVASAHDKVSKSYLFVYTVSCYKEHLFLDLLLLVLKNDEYFLSICKMICEAKYCTLVMCTCHLHSSLSLEAKNRMISLLNLLSTSPTRIFITLFIEYTITYTMIRITMILEKHHIIYIIMFLIFLFISFSFSLLQIHKLISIESHGYDRASLLAHTVDEVRVLLGCA